ncbi:MAG: ArsR/SmtB family transcription factor [Fimbriimonadaceae bacterium]
MTMRQLTAATAPEADDRNLVALEAKLYRGLSDASRLSILKSLLAGQSSVGRLVERTGLSQPNVSGHLACLRDCGLVVSRQEGRCVYYSLADERLELVFAAMGELIDRVGHNIDTCPRYKP